MTLNRPARSAAEVLQAAPELPDRTGDRLDTFNEVAEFARLSPDSLRWLRHQGEGPPMWKMGRRLVAWHSDVVAWVENERLRQADSESKGSA